MKFMYCLGMILFAVLFLAACEEESEPLVLSPSEQGAVLHKSSLEDDAGCRCGKVIARLASTGQINPPLLTAGGELRGNLRGTVSYEAYLADIVPVSSGFGNDPVNPSASFTGTWTLTTARGVLTFRDVGVFEQVPHGLGSSFSLVISGTGCYSGASGYLFLSFIADETGLNFEEKMRGELFCENHRQH